MKAADFRSNSSCYNFAPDTANGCQLEEVPPC